MRQRLVLSTILILLVAAVFGRSLDHDFVNYDDRIYVTENPMLTQDLGGSTLARAWRPYETNWIPLTWISLQLGHAVHGMDPAGFLATNAALHALAAALLFLALARLTGSTGRSAFVAAIFAVHPLHVESVAWISERKDVLSGVFFMLCLLAWARYAERPGPGRHAAVALCLAAGLLAKPMLVTVPFVLWLLDRWPLGRGGRLVEKLPLLALAAAAAVVTYQVQRSTGAMSGFESIPMGWRVANAVDATAIYVVQSFWPSGLAAFYPHPLDALPAWRIAGSAALLLAISGVALAQARRRPYLGVGWLWYLGMLLPVSGLVQVGLQARADRYTYLPQIGLAIAVVWTASDALRSAGARRALAAAGAVGVAVLAALAWIQVGTWRDTETLFARAVQVTRDNYLAHQAVGRLRLAEGRHDEAQEHFREALRLQPEWPAPHLGLAEVLAAHGDTAGARESFEAALRLAPRHVEGRLGYAAFLDASGRQEEAIHQYLRVLRSAQGRLAARAYAGLGSVQLRAGRPAEAEKALASALALGAESPELHLALAEAARGAGRARVAIEHYREALRLDPRSRTAANNLGWLLATHPQAELRDPEEALAHLAPFADDGDPALLDTLAASHAAAGRFQEAEEIAARAVDAARRGGQAALAAEIRRRRALYAAGRPFVER